MSPAQRTLCELLSRLHKDFCEECHPRNPVMFRDGPPLADDPTISEFPLARFQEALAEVFAAGIALDQALKARAWATTPKPNI